MPDIILSPMNEEDYARFTASAIPAYAGYKSRNGDWTVEESQERASKDFAALLPQGLTTADHYFRNIETSDHIVGYCWFAVRKESSQAIAYLYEITVWPSERNKGYGTKAMQAFLEASHHLGANRVMLHVFGFNTDALRLYQRLGFTISDYTLSYSNPPT